MTKKSSLNILRLRSSLTLLLSAALLVALLPGADTRDPLSLDDEKTLFTATFQVGMG